MKIISNSLMLMIIYCLLIGCANSSNNEVSNQRKNVENASFGKLRCEYTYDQDSVRSGAYKCYYPNGELLESGALIKDSIQINERLLFYPSGELREYSFYNPLGELRYRRRYDVNGQVVSEEGDYLGYDQLSSSRISVDDSATFKIFIATPPGVSYRVYGINSGGRYDLKFKETDKSYVRRRMIYGTEPGNFVLPYEIEIIDSVKGDTVTRKSNVSFTVVSHK